NGVADVLVKNVSTLETVLISRHEPGMNQLLANGYSINGSMSADGRYVAFSSPAPNLVRGDRNRSADVFVRDTWRDTITRVSTDSNGIQGNDFSSFPSLAVAADGTVFVAFRSWAKNLVPGDRNGACDIFVKNLTTNATIRVSTASDGTPG